MDVQTRLITPICPNYTEHVWNEVMKKVGFAVKATWRNVDLPTLTLQQSNKYLQGIIVSMRKCLQKHTSALKKAIKSPKKLQQQLKRLIQLWD